MAVIATNVAANTPLVYLNKNSAEQTNLTNKRVLTEAAIAGLSQANQITQSLLTLLR